MAPQILTYKDDANALKSNHTPGDESKSEQTSDEHVLKNSFIVTVLTTAVGIFGTAAMIVIQTGSTNTQHT